MRTETINVDGVDVNVTIEQDYSSTYGATIRQVADILNKYIQENPNDADKVLMMFGEQQNPEEWSFIQQVLNKNRIGIDEKYISEDGGLWTDDIETAVTSAYENLSDGANVTVKSGLFIGYCEF